MQVSPAPPVGGAGQHHQLDPGEGVIFPSGTAEATVRNKGVPCYRFPLPQLLQALQVIHSSAPWLKEVESIFTTTA